MESDVVRKHGIWATRLTEVRLERLFCYKRNAVALQSTLKAMSRQQVESSPVIP